MHHGSRLCFVSALIAGLSAVGLLFGRNLRPEEVAWLLFGYLGILGVTLTLLSARMLFAESEIEHVESRRMLSSR